jgi:hypothetical protein
VEAGGGGARRRQAEAGAFAFDFALTLHARLFAQRGQRTLLD